MLISPAYAQAGGAGPGGLGGLEGLLPFVLIAVVFYFLLIRPQQKRQKHHKELIANLRRGDRVVTAGGIMGTITRVVSDSEVVVEIAPEVKVRVARATISDILAKTEPAAGGDDEPEAEPEAEAAGKKKSGGGQARRKS